MTEFQTLDKAKAGEKISFIGVVIKIGELKSGTNDKGDYTYKRLTIQDSTAAVELTVWNDEIKKFVLGGKYEIIKAYAREYKGSVTLGIQYAEVKLIGTANNESTIDSEMETKTEPEIAPSSEEFLKQKQKELDEKEAKIPQFSDEIKKLINKDALTLFMIKRQVNDHLSQYEVLSLNQGMVWEMTKIIFNRHLSK